MRMSDILNSESDNQTENLCTTNFINATNVCGRSEMLQMRTLIHIVSGSVVSSWMCCLVTVGGDYLNHLDSVLG